MVLRPAVHKVDPSFAEADKKTQVSPNLHLNASTWNEKWTKLTSLTKEKSIYALNTDSVNNSHIIMIS